MARAKPSRVPSLARVPGLLGVWLAVVALGCLLWLAAVDLFHPHLQLLSAPLPSERLLLVLAGCCGIAYWATLACVPGRVAEARGRGGAWWFLASVLFSPLVALAGLALMPVLADASTVAAEMPADEDETDAIETAA